MSAQFAGVCLPLGLPERPAISVSSPSRSLVSRPELRPLHTRTFPSFSFSSSLIRLFLFPLFAFRLVLRETYAVPLPRWIRVWLATYRCSRKGRASTVRRTACRWWQSVCVSRKISVNRFTPKCIACLFVTGFDLISRLITKGTLPFREIPRNKLCRAI